MDPHGVCYMLVPFKMQRIQVNSSTWMPHRVGTEVSQNPIEKVCRELCIILFSVTAILEKKDSWVFRFIVVSA